MYKVATLWLVNQHGELLLARRSDTKQHDPGLWAASAAGRIEAGESTEAALLRETEEELGLKPETYQPVFLFKEKFLHPDGVPRLFSMYGALVDKDITKLIHIDENEVAEIEWRSIAEVRKLLKTKPGELAPASAFELWEKVIAALQQEKLLVAE